MVSCLHIWICMQKYIVTWPKEHLSAVSLGKSCIAGIVVCCLSASSVCIRLGLWPYLHFHESLYEGYTVDLSELSEFMCCCRYCTVFSNRWTAVSIFKVTLARKSKSSIIVVKKTYFVALVCDYVELCFS